MKVSILFVIYLLYFSEGSKIINPLPAPNDLAMGHEDFDRWDECTCKEIQPCVEAALVKCPIKYCGLGLLSFNTWPEECTACWCNFFGCLTTCFFDKDCYGDPIKSKPSQALIQKEETTSFLKLENHHQDLASVMEDEGMNTKSIQNCPLPDLLNCATDLLLLCPVTCFFGIFNPYYEFECLACYCLAFGCLARCFDPQHRNCVEIVP